MTDRDHTAYREEIGAYLLGALTDLRQAFENHLAGCPACRDEIEQLRPAAAALPRSVEQVSRRRASRPRSWRSSSESARRGRWRRRGRRGRRRRPGTVRPCASACGASLRPAAAASALGLVAGFGVAQLGGDDDSRTVVATVDQARIPQGTGSSSGAILRVNGMPDLQGRRVYQAWVQRGGMIIPQPTFEVGPNGSGAVAVPEDLSDAQAVLVTASSAVGDRPERAADPERPALVPLRTLGREGAPADRTSVRWRSATATRTARRGPLLELRAPDLRHARRRRSACAAQVRESAHQGAHDSLDLGRAGADPSADRDQRARLPRRRGGASATGGGGVGGSQLARTARCRARPWPRRVLAHPAGFLHAGFFHLLFNMLSLWILGSMLEPAIGRLRFGLIYFVSLLCGSFGALPARARRPDGRSFGRDLRPDGGGRRRRTYRV